jgi:general secretion pathway protein A
MPRSPFSISPNPTALYATPPLRSILYKVGYAIDHRQGLAAILGDVGTGKSTLLRYLHAEYSAREDIRTLFCPTSDFPSPFGMARKIAEGFGIRTARSLITQREYFERFLIDELKAGRNVVLFLDEAQMLTAECLDFSRTLLNFETSEEKLIQVVMAGQLDLRDRLLTKRHKALRSRIFAPCLLSPMTRDEMAGMLEIRCDRAAITWPFDEAAITALYECSAGVPRAVLAVAELAYGLMQKSGSEFISADLIRAVVENGALDAAAAA